MIRDFMVTFVVAFIAIFVFYFGVLYKPQLDPAKIFSNLYERCKDYVEESAVFDSTDLLKGGLRPSTTRVTDRIDGHSTWHHPQALFVVQAIDRTDQNNGRNMRRCKIGLSSYGERPPVSTIGLAMTEFFAIKRRLVIEGTHVEYRYEDPVPETFAFRSKKLDGFNCAVMHQFLLDTNGEDFSAFIFQEGIACQVNKAQ